MPKYIFYTDFGINSGELITQILRSGDRGIDFAFLKAKTDLEAEQIILDHRNALLGRGKTTSRMYYKIVDINPAIKD